MMKYYLGNNTFFYQDESKLTFENDTQTVVILDNLEASMLTFFLEHAGDDLSKDDLMSLWKAQYVMEHSLTRVISTLRKKLSNNRKALTFIKTIPRVGYKYVGSAELILADNSDRQAIVKKDNFLAKIKERRVFISATCLSFLFILFIGYFSSTKKEEESALNPMLFEIVDYQTVKADLSSSPSGDAIAYSARNEGEFWYLKFNQLANNQNWQLKKDKYNLSSPIWRNADEIIYLQWNSDHCSLRRLNVTQTHVVQDGLLITYCNTSNVSKGLAMLDENTVLLSDSESISSPMQLTEIDLYTGSKSNIRHYETNGHGVYRIFTSPNKKYLATLSSTDWFSTDITIYHADNLMKKVWHKNINYPLFSVAFSDNKVIYKNLKGGLSVASYLHKSEDVKEVPILLTRPVYSPVYTPEGFFFTEGEKYSHKIAVSSIENNENKILINIDNASAKTPTLLPNKNILYTSNQTGINQVWLYNITNQEHSQISNFNHPYFILTIAVNEEGSQLAISTNEGIILADLANSVLVNIRETIDGKLPSFWQGNLIFNRFTEGKNAVFRFNDDLGKAELLIDNGAYKTKSSAGKLYYSKYHTPGVWQFQKGQVDIFISNEYTPNPVDAWNIKDGYLFMGDVDKNQIIRLDIQTKNSDKLTMKECTSMNIISESLCIVTIAKRAPNRLFKFSFSGTYLH